jgi:hypothetical protein
MVSPPKRSPARRRLLLLSSTILLVVIAVAIVPAWRYATLRSVGWLLVAQDALQKADVIAIASDSLAGGALEASDLVAAGYATRVLVFNRPEMPIQRELIRRGAPTYDPAGLQIRILRSQHVNDIVALPPVGGTNDEGHVLQAWCSANSIHSVLFVSDRDHSRRTRRVLERTLGRDSVRSIVRYTRWSPFDPDTWWQTRDGQRIQVEETEKLLLDYLAHPL